VIRWRRRPACTSPHGRRNSAAWPSDESIAYRRPPRRRRLTPIGKIPKSYKRCSAIRHRRCCRRHWSAGGTPTWGQWETAGFAAVGGEAVRTDMAEQVARISPCRCTAGSEAKCARLPVLSGSIAGRGGCCGDTEGTGAIQAADHRIEFVKAAPEWTGRATGTVAPSIQSCRHGVRAARIAVDIIRRNRPVSRSQTWDAVTSQDCPRDVMDINVTRHREHLPGAGRSKIIGPEAAVARSS